MMQDVVVVFKSYDQRPGDSGQFEAVVYIYIYKYVQHVADPKKIKLYPKAKSSQAPNIPEKNDA